MRDMTEGSVFRHLWVYALPLLLGSWFQMGYNAVDSIIVGRFIGRNALACAAGWSVMLLVEVPLCVRELRVRRKQD